MTLAELKQRCEGQGFRYAYGLFKRPVKPPHLVAITRDTENYIADNIVYSKDIPIQLDYTFLEKDVEEQNKIEENILGDIAWNKTEEVYLSDEQIWQVSYFFNI